MTVNDYAKWLDKMMVDRMIEDKMLQRKWLIEKVSTKYRQNGC
jgi:hypothetical protein